MYSRRKFLRSSASMAALLAVYETQAWSKSEDRRWIVAGSGTDFMRFNLATEERQTVRTPTNAHSFSAYPNEVDTVVGLEKWGRNLSVVDFKKSRVVKSIQPERERYFYGHINWSRDHKHLISPQMDLKREQGYLVWYDRESLKMVDQVQLSIRGGNHDLAFLPGTDILAMTCSGFVPEYGRPDEGAVKRLGPSLIAFFDTGTRKITKHWDLNHQNDFPGHLKVGSNGRVYFVGSLPRQAIDGKASGGLYDTTPDQAIHEWPIPEAVKAGLVGELLSLEINESLNRLVVTNPASGQLLTFDLKKREFISATPAATKGIAWDRKHSTLYGFEASAADKKISGFSYQPLASKNMSSHILFVEA